MRISDWSSDVCSSDLPVFAAVKAREGLTAETYALYGHSGGAQFVHRYILAGGGPHMGRAVSANAGSYAMPDPAVAWPFGLRGLPAGLWDPAKEIGRASCRERVCQSV